MSQISKGNIPTREELEDVFTELQQKYYKDVALALLPSKAKDIPLQVTNNVTDAPPPMSDAELNALAGTDPNKARQLKRSANKVDMGKTPNRQKKAGLSPGDQITL